MEQFVSWLQEELEKVDEPKGPEDEVQETDEVLGTASKHIQKIFTVLLECAKKNDEYATTLIDQYGLHKGNLPDEKRRKLESMESRIEVLQELVRHEVHQQFGSHPVLAIREGFTVVRDREREKEKEAGGQQVGLLIGPF